MKCFFKCPSHIASCCDLAFKKSYQEVKLLTNIFRYQLGVWCRRYSQMTFSVSLFADKELWTNSSVWIHNIFSSVCKWPIIILLIFSSRSFEWNLFMQSISKLRWRWVSKVICVFLHSPKFDIHITHTSNHWKNKHWLSQGKSWFFFFPEALNDFLSILRDLIIRDSELPAGFG